MSERKSWDVRPKRPIGAIKRAPPAASSQRRVPVDAVRATRKPGAAPTVRSPRPRAPQTSSGRLRDRRRQARKRSFAIIGIFFAVLVVLALIAVWRPQVRVTDVTAEGPGAEQAVAAARGALSGTYAFILPRNSIFFLPKGEIRQAVLASQPEIAALSIRRTSFHSIALTGTPRAKAFIWCGTAIDIGFADGGCFEADAEGLVFKQAGVSTTTVVLTTGSETPTTAGDLRIFAPLDRELVEGTSPVGARIINHEAIPNALRFVKAIRGLGVPVSALALRGDEADLWLSGPTRITYVLGAEEMAAQLAASVVPALDLTNGSVQYVDLRFCGKAYVKKHGE